MLLPRLLRCFLLHLYSNRTINSSPNFRQVILSKSGFTLGDWGSQRLKISTLSHVLCFLGPGTEYCKYRSLLIKISILSSGCRNCISIPTNPVFTSKTPHLTRGPVMVAVDDKAMLPPPPALFPSSTCARTGCYT